MQRVLRGMMTIGVLFAWQADAALLAEENPPKSDQEKSLLVPLPSKVSAPVENPTTAAKVALGKQLFFDSRLSGSGRMSCATCHLPEKAFTDGLPVGNGAGGKKLIRNTPTLLNTAFQSRYLWDGRAGSLEEQALKPIASPDEMNQNLHELENELNAVSGYGQQFRAIFKAPVTRAGIAKALAAFQRTLITGNSPFDRYLKGDEQALSDKARQGMRLFVGEAGCVRCHHGPLLSDGKFHRIGVSFRDPGRGAVTGKEEDRYAFRTPSLRDVARTGPYMHDGSIKTLEEVVFFYFRSVPLEGPDGLPLDVQPRLGQSLNDLDALVAFLKSLSGDLPKIEPPQLP